MRADEGQISFQRLWRGKGFRLGARSKRAFRVAIEALLDEHMSRPRQETVGTYTLSSVMGRRPIPNVPMAVPASAALR